MIFDAGKTAHLRRRQIAPNIIEVEVKPDVAIEIPVTRIARITLLPAPDLFGGLEVAAERGNALGCKNRRKHAVTRTRACVQDAVRIHDEPADVRLLQDTFHAFRVSAFRQPDAGRIAIETTPVLIARDEDLGARGGWMIGEQRQQRVSGRAVDDLDPVEVLESLERADQVVAAGNVGVEDSDEALVI